MTDIREDSPPMTALRLERQARIAVIYYSATGNVHAMAHAVADGAAREGAEVRLRHVAELSEEMLISLNQYWGRHRSEVEGDPVAELEDLEWADGIAFGTPTRFGNVAAQLKLQLSSRSGTRSTRSSTAAGTPTAPPSPADTESADRMRRPCSPHGRREHGSHVSRG